MILHALILLIQIPEFLIVFAMIGISVQRGLHTKATGGNVVMLSQKENKKAFTSFKCKTWIFEGTVKINIM